MGAKTLSLLLLCLTSCPLMRATPLEESLFSAADQAGKAQLQSLEEDLQTRLAAVSSEL